MPYVLEDQCPFECCTYGEWTAEQRIPVYAGRAASGAPVDHIAAGETFQARTGEVVVREPGRVAVREPYEVWVYRQAGPQEPGWRRVSDTVPAGGTLYVLSYVGEGVWNVWYRGETYQDSGMRWRFGRDPERRSAEEVSATLQKKPETEWWVEVSTADIETGWILMSGVKVDGNDACTIDANQFETGG